MVFISLFELLITLILLFIACELAGLVSNEFQNINDLIDQFDWYLFPLEMKKILPFIMLNAQQSVDFECFGSLACNRETFKKVNNSFFTHKSITNNFLD